ncbi:MAG: tetratricopeptide repeat protein, partial [Planctomycetota bacterium]|nr:tetratricopeptide repeat protein [Planctomycetota bacterium]
MPVWHAKTRALREAGKLKVIGVVQEQHPDRALLYARWQGLDWPILWDPFNLTGTRVVLRVTLIDEHGIVRALEATPESVATFAATTYDAPAEPVPVAEIKPGVLPQALAAKAGSPQRRTYEALAALLWPLHQDGDRALHELADLAAAQPEDADAAWRLGVAYRMRLDSAERQEGDFQRAIDYWRRGLALDPGHYIHRRRIQQYGPR